MKAEQFLRKGAELLEERGKQYDQPGGERSMGKAVQAFNAITGRDLTEPEGWLLLQVLKDVRQWQNPNKYHADSAEDCVSYAALKAEALSESQCQAIYCETINFGSAPVDVDVAVDHWRSAPPQATHLLYNHNAHKFAIQDGSRFRDCDTLFVIDMQLWPIIQER